MSEDPQNQINQEEFPKPCLYAMLPSYVRHCDELEFGARLLYAEITALSTNEGYCWASNAYLANLYKTEERTIQRWLNSLKKQGFIIIDLEKEGIKTKRKIWPSKEIKKIFTTRQNCRPRHDKNVIQREILLKEESLDIKISKEEGPNGHSASKSSIIFSFEDKKFSGITDSQIQAWEKEFPKINVREIIPKIEEWCSGHPSRIKARKNFLRTIVHWLKSDNESASYNQDQRNKLVEENKKIVKELQEYLERSQYQGCNLSIQGNEAYDSVKSKRCPITSPSMHKILGSWYGITIER